MDALIHGISTQHSNRLYYTNTIRDSLVRCKVDKLYLTECDGVSHAYTVLDLVFRTECRWRWRTLLCYQMSCIQAAGNSVQVRAETNREGGVK